MITLLIATRNAHKLGEIRAILGPEFRCLGLDTFPGAPEVVEDSGTFEGNAVQKAVELAKWISSSALAGSPQVPTPDFVMADDSGLEVDALNGAPGVQSARFAALDTGEPGNSPTAANSAKLMRLLEGVPADRRSARFRCVVALTPIGPRGAESASPVCSADEFEFSTEIFHGVCEGRIGLSQQGRGGFGYDPLFYPDGYDQTFGELFEEIKNRLSHRARALERMRQRLRGGGHQSAC
jgi:XTP/dITP diphosphohydrolase